MAYQPPHQPGYQPAPPYYPSQQYQPYPPPQPMAQQHSHTSNNVVVVSQPAAPQVHHTYVERDSPNHLLHCVITFFCPWWIFIWLIICCVYGC